MTAPMLPSPAVRLPGWLPASAIVVLAGLLLTAPSWIIGAGESHSSIMNHVWASQISSQILHGEIYPRWVAGSNDGLGSPAFYFYPPLAFFAAALIDGLCGGHLPAALQLGLASALFMIASGLAMRLWLRGQVDPRTATLGAVAYMAAPYHLIDHLLRGALAEFSAYAVLPLVAWSLRRAALRDAVAWLAAPAAYAALILAHLPTAGLASLAMPGYVLYLAATERTGLAARAAFVAKAAAMGGLGALLAAGYWLPAVTLTGHISTDQLWGAVYQPARWLLVAPQHWLWPPLMMLLALASAASAVLAACAIWRVPRAGAAARDARSWGVAALACLVLMSGLVPGFWSLPLAARVQFPWRFLAIVEFTAVTASALALTGRPLTSFGRPGVIGLGLAGIAWAATLFSAWPSLEGARATPRLAAADHMRDASEYMPAGFFGPALRDADATATRDTATQRMAEAAANPPIAVVGRGGGVGRAGPGGAMVVDVDAAGPVRIVLRRFYFPAWAVTDLADGRRLTASAYGRDRLLGFEAPAGRHRYAVAIAPLPVERIGWRASAAALAAMLAALAIARRRRDQV